LAEEGVRWKNNVAVLGKDMECLVGDTFVSAALMSYCGAFTSAFRKELSDFWIQKMKEFSIPSGEKYNMINIMGNPIYLREWSMQGLPEDEISKENAIMVQKANRWPLLIDPQ
jgi:dynein heavy chain